MWQTHQALAEGAVSRRLIWIVGICGAVLTLLLSQAIAAPLSEHEFPRFAGNSVWFGDKRESFRSAFFEDGPVCDLDVEEDRGVARNDGINPFSGHVFLKESMFLAVAGRPMGTLTLARRESSAIPVCGSRIQDFQRATYAHAQRGRLTGIGNPDVGIDRIIFDGIPTFAATHVGPNLRSAHFTGNDVGSDRQHDSHYNCDDAEAPNNQLPTRKSVHDLGGFRHAFLGDYITLFTLAGVIAAILGGVALARIFDDRRRPMHPASIGWGLIAVLCAAMGLTPWS